MPRKVINTGAYGNDPNADKIKASFDKSNDNFDELYTRLMRMERLSLPPDYFVAPTTTTGFTYTDLEWTTATRVGRVTGAANTANQGASAVLQLSENVLGIISRNSAYQSFFQIINIASDGSLTTGASANLGSASNIQGGQGRIYLNSVVLSPTTVRVFSTDNNTAFFFIDTVTYNPVDGTLTVVSTSVATPAGVSASLIGSNSAAFLCGISGVAFTTRGIDNLQKSYSMNVFSRTTTEYITSDIIKHISFTNAVVNHRSMGDDLCLIVHESREIGTGNRPGVTLCRVDDKGARFLDRVSFVGTYGGVSSIFAINPNLAVVRFYDTSTNGYKAVVVGIDRDLGILTVLSDVEGSGVFSLFGFAGITESDNKTWMITRDANNAYRFRPLTFSIEDGFQAPATSITFNWADGLDVNAQMGVEPVRLGPNRIAIFGRTQSSGNPIWAWNLEVFDLA